MPDVAVLLPGGDCQRGLELAHLERQGLVGIEAEARAIENKFVLAANLGRENKR